uniref:BTB domain-containing protein n=1 Tax=Timema bartmani TaxID=61472 RepID=A0A7R9EMS0_9NEOP|nr:unnamed protein product [Timema bartmani]
MLSLFSVEKSLLSTAVTTFKRFNAFCKSLSMVATDRENRENGSCPCTTMGSNQQFSLRWNNYLRHITNAFDSLRSDEDLVDVTLSCEGKRIRAHKMLLSACSTYFRDLFKLMRLFLLLFQENPCQHPVIIFRSVKFEDLSALIDFMYQGEVNVVQDQLASFLTTAELLAVQGLSDGRDAPGPTGDDEDDIKEIEIPDSPGTPKEPEVPVIKPTKKTVPASAGASNVRVSSPQAQQYPDKKPSAQYTDKKPPAQTASAPSSSSEPTAHPPAPKRRKWSAEKATPSPAPRNLAPSPDPIEVIPVMPNLKVEAPDYCELGDDDGSYGDSNSGPGGGPDPMAQLLDSKQDFSELYSTNSRDSSLTQSESFLASDLSQLLSKPGPSGENQSQDSLQGEYSEVLSLRPLHPGSWNNLQYFAISPWNNLQYFATSPWNNLQCFAISSWNNIQCFAISSWNNIQCFAISSWNIIQCFAISSWNIIQCFAISSWNNILCFVSNS